MATYGYTFQSGDGVTPTRLNDARTVSDIVNADIKSDAAIAGTKIAPAFGAQNITVSTANRSITNTGNFALSFGTNNAERMRIDASGNVGINTATPSRYLHVALSAAPAGNQNQKTGLLIANADSTGTSGSPNSAAIQFAFDPASPRGYIESGTFGLDFMAFGFAGAERMRIDASGNVGIGTASPNAVAILDASSTTKGFLPPRMTTAQRDAISTPPAGLVIYNTSTNVLNFYNGSAWGAV